MEAESAVLKQILYMEALTTASWRKYFSSVVDAGIVTVDDLLETPDQVLDGLKAKIPPAPLTRIKTLKEHLIKIKLQQNNSFITPLSQNTFFDNYEFVPQFICEQYLADTTMNHIAQEIEKAKTNVAKIDCPHLTEHQSTFIALYCQESPPTHNSFYFLVNQCVRERSEQLIAMRPALFLLESGLRSLPMIEDVTWRGMNIAPDLKKFVTGQTVTFSGICSTSMDKDQTLRFMEVSPRSGIHQRTLFKLYMAYGIPIQNWSCWPAEQEVVASFGSRWEVIGVEKNRNELFDSVGDYHCDYYIELRQLPNEPLFRPSIELAGLHLLSKVNFKEPEDLSTNFKAKFVGFFHQLKDLRAQALLESVLEASNYWNSEDKTFKNNPENREIFSLISHFLEGVRTLSDEFHHNVIDTERGFQICEANGIYATIHLLYDKEDGGERTIANLEKLGFDTESATKLYNQEHVKEELKLMYQRSNYSGTLEEPQNVSKWLSRERFKHYIKKDGIMVSLYEVAHLSMNSLKRWSPQLRSLLNGSIQLDNYTILGRTVSYQIQYTDFAIAAVIFAVQFGMYSFQLWQGDITTRQFLKCISTCAVSVGCGFAGGFAAGYFAAFCAGLIGLTGWPVTVLVVGGTAIGGLACGGGADYAFRKLTEKFFPDGEEEELNAQRKLYCAALDTLACTPDSTMATIQRTYYRKALATHPDKCDNKGVAEEDFKRLVAAYEIAKTYHEALEDACRTLSISSNFTIEDLKSRKSTLMGNAEKKRAYHIAYRHAVYNTNKWKRIRNWLDGDQNLKLRDSKPSLPIQ